MEMSRLPIHAMSEVNAINTIMNWEFQNFDRIVNSKTSATPFANRTLGIDMIIYELSPSSVSLV